MRKLLFIGLLGPTLAFAQDVDRASYQKRFDDCNAEKEALTQKMLALRQEKKTAIEEFRQGLFCSDCKRSKSEVEKQDRIDFQSHIAAGAKNGRKVVAATPEQIAKKEQEYNNKISQAENNVDGKRLDCERISAEYTKATKQAQQKQQQSALAEQQKQQQTATNNAKAAEADRQKQQAEAQQKALAELERQRLLQQQKDRQLAANQAQLDNEMADNNANTQSKLDHHRANNTLDDVPQDNFKYDAKDVVKNTSSRSLAEAAFEKVKSSPYVQKGMDYLREKRDNLKKKWVDEQVDDVARIFGIKTSKEEEEHEEEKKEEKDEKNNKPDTEKQTFLSPYKKQIKKFLKDEAIQGAKNYFEEFASKNRELKPYYELFDKSRAEVKKYDAITLTEYHQEVREHLGKLFNAFDSSNTAEIEAVDKEFWQTLPKKTFGLVRHYVLLKKSPVEDIKIIANGKN